MLTATVSTISVFAFSPDSNTWSLDHTAIQTAIENWNYDALPDQMKERVSPEKFENLKTRFEDGWIKEKFGKWKGQRWDRPELDEATKLELENLKTTYENAIINNDFVSFKSVIESKKSIMEANRPEGKEVHTRRSNLSEEQMESKLKEKFDKQVQRYQETGELKKDDRKWPWRKWIDKGCKE